NNERGTGVLITDDLVLTNYHVLTKQPADLLTNAKTVTLRFGAFTADKPGVSPDAGQTIRLHAALPVVAQSPVWEYDFVLLRTDGSMPIDSVATAAANITPTPDSAMHILQHPHG